MMKKIGYGLVAVTPVFAFAILDNITNMVKEIAKIVGLIIPIFFALAIIYFFWGLIEYIRSAGDPKKASEGKSIMIWGVIAIAVMVSIYGIVAWLGLTFGIVPTTTPPAVPTVPGL